MGRCPDLESLRHAAYTTCGQLVYSGDCMRQPLPAAPAATPEAAGGWSAVGAASRLGSGGRVGSTWQASWASWQVAEGAVP